MSTYIRFGSLFDEESRLAIGKNASNITGCPNGVTWIWDLMGDCVVTDREQASAYLGLASMALWILVGVPQIIKNFRDIDGLGGISFFLLFQWASGDITNLVGSFLTNQLKPQIYLACYFVFSDAVLLTQYSIYSIRRRRKRKMEEKAAVESGVQPPRLILCLMGLFFLTQTFFGQGLSSLSSLSSYSNDVSGHMTSKHLSRSLLSLTEKENSMGFEPGHPLRFESEISAGDQMEGLGIFGQNKLHKVNASPSFWHNKLDIIGYVIGVLSSIFYLGSRMAQIYKNVKSKSTEGLAVMTFLLAVLGNLAYGGQIVVLSVETEFLLEKTPWLVGSLGVVGLDCTLLAQFYYYDRKHRNTREINERLLNNEYTINGHVSSRVEQASHHQDYIY